MKLIHDEGQLSAISGGSLAAVTIASVTVSSLIIGPMWGVFTAGYLRTTFPTLNLALVCGAAVAMAIATGVLGSCAFTGLYLSTNNLVYGLYDQCPAYS